MSAVTKFAPAPLRRIITKLPHRRRQRQFERHPCCITGTIRMDGTNYEREGLILELSVGGLLFREASHFILQTEGVGVDIQFLDRRMRGTIVNTQDRGYGIKLATTLAEEEVEQLVEQHGVFEHDA
jgi:thermostable 8-oxoguanine DNA glycosylase